MITRLIGLARYVIAIMVVLTFALVPIISSSSAYASARPSPSHALSWAESHGKGHWYLWGGTGPNYDCSGLVMEAYGHADHVWLPHYTVAMVHSGHLVRTYHPVPGNLAFWGSINAPYHVGFVTSIPHTAFGALKTGTRIGFYSWRYWPPSAFYYVR